MIYDDGTMDVDVGGVIERRPYHIERNTDRFGLGGERFQLPKYVPELCPGEAIAECIADPIPKIYKTGR